MNRSYHLISMLSLICLLTFLLFSGGCWDRREINQLAFVASIAADLKGTERLLTGEIVHPIAGGSGSGATSGGESQDFPIRHALIISGYGETLLSAARSWAMKLPRRAYVAHTNTVLVGEEMARSGLREILSHIDRNPEFRRTALVLLTRDLAQGLLIKAQGSMESTLGKEVQGLKRWGELSGYGFIPDVNQVYQDLSSAAITTVLPLLDLIHESLPPKIGAGEANGENQPPTEGAPPLPVEEPKIIRNLVLNGAGFFQQDRLAGWFDAEQYRGWAWVNNKVTRAILELPGRGNNNKISVEIFSSEARIDIETQGDQLGATIKLNVDGNLLEQQCSTDFTNQEGYEYIEAQMAARIAAEINNALQVAQPLGVDVFNIATAIHHQHPRLWHRLEERWPREFMQLPINIEIQTTLDHTGLTGHPWGPEYLHSK